MAEAADGKKKKFQCLSNRLCSSTKTKRNHKRLVSKHGQFYVNLDKISLLEKMRKYTGDGVTTFLDIQWRWALLIFCMGYLLTWISFACYYFAFGHVHGDIVDEGHPGNFTPCVANVHSFTTAVLFSVESQHTIGYGYRAVTDECPHIITAVFFQFIIGLGVQCLIAGLVFAKLQRAKKRSETVLFSSLACVCYFNGKLRLSIRVGNLRPSHLLEVTAMGMLVKKKTTDEGDEIPFHQQFLDFRSESDGDNINLLWPAVLYHTIDENSPLKNVSSRAVLARYSELVVVLEGVVDSTSRTFQARTSYLPEEILYGYRFKCIAPLVKHDGLFRISYMDFNVVIQQHFLRQVSGDRQGPPILESRGCQTEDSDREEDIDDLRRQITASGFLSCDLRRSVSVDSLPEGITAELLGMRGDEVRSLNQTATEDTQT
ncbi:ATP-sensitive inward rectifier potassium channel 10-like [Liolophura sinensis]|uniref:ATP-sensitive inward rectifier potassium channel 10-like n=1 Tax=Liolophura sinensis TaxID=3198878 RepID=UPI003159228D